MIGDARERPVVLGAGLFLAMMVAAAVSAPWWAPSPTAIDLMARLSPPSVAHWFGTDNFGRDLLSRVVYGARISLAIAFAVMLGAGALGTVSGLLAGYYPRVDAVLMRVLDGLMAFPALLLALALVATLGGNLSSEIVALTIVFWPRMARLMRSSAIALRGRPFVEAAVAIGASDRTILFDHILRNARAPLIAGSTFIYAEAMIADATLSFLGLGVKPPTPTWGNILGDSRAYLVNAPWFSVFAGLAIVTAVLALNLIGDALRASADAHAGHEGSDS